MGIDKGLGIASRRTWIRKTDKDAPIPYKEEDLIGFLKSCDANKDGRLSTRELKNAFERLGSRFPSWRVNRALHHADANGDGYISEEEFGDLVKYVLKCGYKIK